MQQVQYYSCKEYEYIVAYYAKKSCNYCKKLAHIIKECPIHPQNRQANQVVGNQAIDDKSTLTPKMVQQMIISVLRLQVKSNLLSLVWLVDSGASNHQLLQHP